jgi:peptidoglycan/xylan/chitin deacetylase (PgdA/CDA1 family)
MNHAIPVLMHHHVTPHQGLVTVSPDMFEQQIRWLSKRGYQSITCAQFVDFLQGKPIPSKSVLITFDDGYLDNYVYAYPILRQYQMHAVLFIVTGWIGDGTPRAYYQGIEDAALPECPNHRRCMMALKENEADEVMLRWSEIEVMQNDGTFEFHSHTHTHTRWDKVFAANRQNKREGLMNDLLQAQSRLMEKLGQESHHLCWPQGYYDQDYIEIALALGYRYLYTVNKQINDRTSDPLKIGRVVIKNKVNPWFASRMWLYGSAWLGKAYLALRGTT